MVVLKNRIKHAAMLFSSFAICAIIAANIEDKGNGERKHICREFDANSLATSDFHNNRYSEVFQIQTMARYVRRESTRHRNTFKSVAKKVIGQTVNQATFALTNSIDQISIVYSGTTRCLLMVQVNRVSGTNEVFRFSRQTCGITSYEAFDAMRNGIAMLFHTNGTLRCYALIRGGTYQDKEYHFDETGHVLRIETVANKPIFKISPPQNTKRNHLFAPQSDAN